MFGLIVCRAITITSLFFFFGSMFVIFRGSVANVPFNGDALGGIMFASFVTGVFSFFGGEAFNN